MSADCLFVLRNVNATCELREKLEILISSCGCGVLYEPVDALIICKQVIISNTDFIFEPTDYPDSISSDLLLSHENIYINGETAALPLYTRLKTIQRFAELCIGHASPIEIYISEDNPYLPDYSLYNLTCYEIADVLYKEYQACKQPYPYIPNVHLLINH